MQLLPNPDLCPTHKCTMMQIIAGRYNSSKAMICHQCKSDAGFRKMFIKYKITRLKRSYRLSIMPSHAELFEGL